MKFKTIIELDLSIPSVNYSYKPGRTKNGKLYLFKDRSVVKFQEELFDKCYETDLRKAEKLDDTYAVELQLIFYLRQRFWNRDLSNMIKAVEDVIVKITKVDDSRTIKINAEKRQTTEQEKVEIMFTSIKKGAK